MKDYTLQKRTSLYQAAFPDWPPPVVDDAEGRLDLDGKRIYGMWILGNDYRGTGFYGSYPPNYLKRVNAMFPDAEKVLHLFSGSVGPGNYTRFDLSEKFKPDVLGNAEELDKHFSPGSFDLILADPPYSTEDAKLYGFPMIKRRAVLAQCHLALQKGGFLVWLDTVMPMYRKDEWDWVGVIGIVRSGNHRFRMTSIFQKR